MQESRQPNDTMIQFARSVLLRWFNEYDYDADEIELGEFDKLAAWVAAYCIHDAKPEIVDRPRQCLWICGQCGRGKTALVRILRDKLIAPEIMPMRNADDISRALADDDGLSSYDGRLLLSASKDLIIDDLGAEELRTHYGNTTEMPQLLSRLYELWRYSGKLLIVTSNYTLNNAGLNELRKRYGERVADRLKEMFADVWLTGRNWRRDNG